jgi:hypothetical protein
MPTTSTNLEARISALSAVLTRNDDKKVVKDELKAVNGDFNAALEKLKHKVSETSLQKVVLAHALAEWSDDNLPLVKALATQPEVSSLRDLALKFNIESLRAVVDPQVVPANIAGATPEEKARNFAVTLRQRLFAIEPTAVLHRMVEDAEVPIADGTLRSGVSSFLTNQPDFNIRTTSVYTALRQPDAIQRHCGCKPGGDRGALENSSASTGDQPRPGSNTRLDEG